MIQPGTHLGPYAIVGPLGKGGMGEVYRATDTRLERTVAIKVLPEEMAADPDRLERFEREARAVSSLSHPHICVLHDVGDQDGIHYLVMELVEGPTLEERLTKGPLPLERVLEYGVQIADALDKAHRRGVVHRDLKPGNIMITPSGVKLLDFGLAKLKGPVSPAADMPTAATGPLTREGTILGTLQYMAPEQLEGKEADARSDIFAFGAVVYEMVTGRRAFDGPSSASVISRVMSGSPPPMTDVAMTPEGLDHIVRTCLSKDPDDRWQSARDLARELGRVTPSRSSSEAIAAPQPAPKGWTVPAVTGLVLLAGVAIGAFLPGSPFFGTGDDGAFVSRLSLPLYPAETYSSYALSTGLAISPDGSRVAFSSGAAQLWIRDLADDEARFLSEDVRAVNMTFSPDGEWLAVTSANRLLKIPVAGGSAVTLVADAGEFANGLSWGEDGFIVYGVGERTSVLMRVHEDGGEPVRLVADTDSPVSRDWPWVVDGGRAVIYSELDLQINRGNYDASRLMVTDVATRESRTLDLPGGSGARVVGNHIVYGRLGNLMAAPFDPERLEVTGPAQQVLAGIAYDVASGAGQWAVSENGTLVFQEQSEASTRLMWLEPAGGTEPAFPRDRAFYDPRLAPLGGDSRVAVEVGDEGDELWVLNLERGTQDVLSVGSETEDETPAWSPDGRYVVWTTGADGARQILRRTTDRSAPPEELWVGERHVHVSGYAPDGGSLVFETEPPDSGIWLLPLNDAGSAVGPENPARPLIDDAGANEFNARVAPNGRWISYVSDASGTRQIYVQPFPGGGPIELVSPGGEPVWSPDSSRLYYRDGGGIWSVDVTSGETLDFGRPQYVFDDVYGSKGTYHIGYDVAADGRILIVGSPGNSGKVGYLRLYENWMSEVAARVPFD